MDPTTTPPPYTTPQSDPPLVYPHASTAAWYSTNASFYVVRDPDGSHWRVPRNGYRFKEPHPTDPEGDPGLKWVHPSMVTAYGWPYGWWKREKALRQLARDEREEEKHIAAAARYARKQELEAAKSVRQQELEAANRLRQQQLEEAKQSRGTATCAVRIQTMVTHSEFVEFSNLAAARRMSLSAWMREAGVAKATGERAMLLSSLSPSPSPSTASTAASHGSDPTLAAPDPALDRPEP